MGTVDTMMVSNVGSAAISAVSLVDSINILVIQALSALAAGGAILCSQYLGSEKRDGAIRSAQQVLFVMTVLSVALSAGCLIFRVPLLRVIFGAVEADVMKNSQVYFLFTLLSFPFIGLYDAGASILRAQNNSRSPMVISVISNFMNIGGNAILIFGFHMGVEGAAISTLISRIFCAVVVLWKLRDESKPIFVKQYLSIRPDFGLIKKILFIGIPSGIENSMFQLGKIMVLSMITQFGTASIAANAVSNTIAVFQTLPGMAIGNAVLTVSAQCAGAGDYEQVKYYAKKLHIIIYGLMIVCCLGVIAALPAVLHVYSLSAEATAMTEDIIVYHGICCMIIWPIAFNLPNVLRASNDVAFCMILSILSMWICRIGMSYVLGVRMGFGVFGVWVAMTMDWVVRAIFFVLRYRSGKWQHQT